MMVSFIQNIYSIGTVTSKNNQSPEAMILSPIAAAATNIYLYPAAISIHEAVISAPIKYSCYINLLYSSLV